jgi:hypothetical protein
VIIDTSKKWSLDVQKCVDPPDVCGTPLGAGPWTVEIFDANNTLLTTVAFKDTTKNIVDIEIPIAKGSKFSYNGDSLNDGPDFVQKDDRLDPATDDHLDHATVNGQSKEYKCPAGSAPGPKACEIQIHKQ